MIPLDRVTRDRLLPLETRLDTPRRYDGNIDKEMVARSQIISNSPIDCFDTHQSTTKTQRLESDGPFDPGFLTDAEAVAEILRKIFQNESVWTHLSETYKKEKNGRKMMAILKTHLIPDSYASTLWSRNKDHRANLIWDGKNKNFDFTKFRNRASDLFTVAIDLARDNPGQFPMMTNHERFDCFMSAMQCAELNPLKAVLIADPVCKDNWEACAERIADYLQKSNQHTVDLGARGKRKLAELRADSGRDGGGGRGRGRGRGRSGGRGRGGPSSNNTTIKDLDIPEADLVACLPMVRGCVTQGKIFIPSDVCKSSTPAFKHCVKQCRVGLASLTEGKPASGVNETVMAACRAHHGTTTAASSKRTAAELETDRRISQLSETVQGMNVTLNAMRDQQQRAEGNDNASLTSSQMSLFNRDDDSSAGQGGRSAAARQTARRN